MKRVCSSMHDDAAAIRCRDLRHRYGEVVAVDGIDLEVRRGECFGLLGPNGAGKTTTVEILEGLLVPTAGSVEVLGMRWGTDAWALRQRVGVTLQETRLSDRLTVRETLTLFRSFYAKRRDVDEVLENVRLTDKANARYHQLSGGQKQRVAVACALISMPEVLFLDEPTTGLDPQSRRQLWDLVTSVKAAGTTVVLTTHYMDEAEKLCDRVAIVDRGKIIARGTPAELIRDLGVHEVVEIAVPSLGSADELKLLAGVKSVRATEGLVTIGVTSLATALPAILAELSSRGLEIESLRTHRATLEDCFLHLTGRHLRD